jgi:phosphatidylserine/phosphatidylglycerophosphate/cardiolipin synthase-like enzyme
VILVDERDLLVTSANLTGAGMETNLELGVRLQGETARNCSEHFANLMAVNFFTLEEWP